MTEPERAGVSESDWTAATASCCALRVREVIEETRDARSIVFDVPDDTILQTNKNTAPVMELVDPEPGRNRSKGGKFKKKAAETAETTDD